MIRWDGGVVGAGGHGRSSWEWHGALWDGVVWQGGDDVLLGNLVGGW